MASFFSHPAVPAALKLSGLRVSKRLFWLSMVLTCFPDADVIAFRFGIPYSSQWGHRGFTHSIVFAIFCGALCTLIHEKLGEKKLKVFLWTFFATLSHPVFDALTNGGLGVAFFWPFNHERYFFPWTPVKVSPIGVHGFLSSRGLEVIISELKWLWIPSLLFGGGGRIFLKWREGRES
jgi:inner membrane protein